MKTKVNPKIIPILFLATLMIIMVLPMTTIATIDGPALARDLDELNLSILSEISEYTTEEKGRFWNFRTGKTEKGVWTTYYGSHYVDQGGFTPPSRFVYANGIDVLWLYGFTHFAIFYGENSAIIISWGPSTVCWQNAIHTPE